MRRVGVAELGQRDGEVLCLVVVHDDEHVTAVENQVVDVVLHALTPLGDELGLGLGRAEVEGTDLGRRLRGGADEQEAAAGDMSRPTQYRSSGLGEDGRVGGRVGAQPVSAHLVRAPRVVNDRVEDGAPVGGPGGRVEDAWHFIGKQLAGANVLDPQREPLVTDGVDREGEQVAVGADRRAPMAKNA